MFIATAARLEKSVCCYAYAQSGEPGRALGIEAAKVRGEGGGPDASSSPSPPAGVGELRPPPPPPPPPL
jgi:hypothetical protein